MYIYKWPADKENGTGIVTQHNECKVEGELLPVGERRLRLLSKFQVCLVEALKADADNRMQAVESVFDLYG